MLAGWSNLGRTHFPFITLNMSRHSLLTCWVSAEKSAATLKGVPCRFFVWIFSCYFFVSLVWLICFSLGLSCVGLSALPELVWLFPVPCCKILDYNCFKYFLWPFLFFFWDPYNSNVGAFNVIAEVSETVTFGFILFLYSALLQLFPPFCLPAHYVFFCLGILLLILSSVCFISVIVLLIPDCLFFSSRRTRMFLLNISYIFPICASTSETLHHLSYHLCILFQVECHFTSLSSGILSYSSIWGVFLCCLTLSDFLWL